MRALLEGRGTGQGFLFIIFDGVSMDKKWMEEIYIYK